MHPALGAGKYGLKGVGRAWYNFPTPPPGESLIIEWIGLRLASEGTRRQNTSLDSLVGNARRKQWMITNVIQDSASFVATRSPSRNGGIDSVVALALLRITIAG
jgi:hypothetical protein